MSEATKDLDRRLEKAEEYYRMHDCSIREAARATGLLNHVSLSSRIHGKRGSKADTGGYNRLLSPA
jgi:hypothetical protein